MSLSAKQKKYLLKHLKIHSLADISTQLNVEQKELLKYLKKRWGKEKMSQYQSISSPLKKQKSPDVPGLPGSFSLKAWLIRHKYQLILLTVLVFTAYANSLPNQFLSDDIATIRDNPNLKSFSYVTSQTPVVLRPFLLFLVNAVFGKTAFFYRLLNVFFHLGTVITLYFILTFLFSRPLALMAAVLAAVHPLESEAVAWISGGPYTQSAFFYLLALAAFLFGEKNKKYYYFSLLFYFLALLSSEKSMSFGITLFTLVIAHKSIKKQWKSLIAPFLLTAAWVSLYIVKIPQRISTLQTDYYQSPQTINPLLQIPISISNYLMLIIWPKALTLYHSEMHMISLEYILRFSLTLLFLLFTLYLLKVKHRLFFWLAFFVITLLPTLTPWGISWIVAERYVYLGAMGIYVAVAWIFYRLYKNKKYQNLCLALFILLTSVLTIRTIIRNIDWKDQDHLWLAAAKTSPSSPQNHNNLGDYYGRTGDLPKAAAEFKRAIELNPRYADAMHNLANIYVQMQKYDEALAEYQQAIDNNPKLWQSYQNMAYIYFNRGDLAKAQEKIEAAIAVSPDNANLYQNLAVIYEKLEDSAKAQEYQQKAILLDPSLAPTPVP